MYILIIFGMAKLKLEGKFLEIVRVIAYVEFIVESDSLTSDKLISYISEYDFFEYTSRRVDIRISCFRRLFDLFTSMINAMARLYSRIIDDDTVPFVRS